MIFAIQPRQIHMIWRGRKRADTVIYYAFARMQPIISFFFFISPFFARKEKNVQCQITAIRSVNNNHRCEFHRAIKQKASFFSALAA